MLLLVFFVSCESIVDNHQFDSSDPSTGSIVALSMHEGDENGEDAKTITLFAGQDMDVGVVNVSNDGDYIYVEYVLNEDAIEEGWCITETHVHIGTSLTDFPLEGRWGNPAPGQFDYKEYHDPCVDNVNYEIPIDPEWGKDLLIATHAALESQITEAIIYGVTQDGEIFTIDMLNGKEEILTDNLNNEGGNNWPNGLAFDQENGRLYYADGSDRNQIWFYDMDTGENHPAGTAGGVVAGAEFANGAYWYIVNGTDEFRKMTFDADGKNGVDEFVSKLGTSHNLGDLAVNFSETILYGHSNTSRGNAFFSIDLDDFAYTEIKQPAGKNLQIAFGSDGILYGVTTGTKNWYMIDLITGERTPVRDALNSYTDLANGREFKIKTETAWGAFDVGDIRFTDQGNWATYFEYSLQPVLIEYLEVNSRDMDGTTSETVLLDDVQYQFKISGTWTNRNGLHKVDAFYNNFELEANEPWKAFDSKNLQLQIDEEFVDPLPDFNPDHVYYIDFEGSGDKVNFKVFEREDSWYNDNKGSLNVKIYQIPW